MWSKFDLRLLKLLVLPSSTQYSQNIRPLAEHHFLATPNRSTDRVQSDSQLSRQRLLKHTAHTSPFYRGPEESDLQILAVTISPMQLSFSKSCIKKKNLFMRYSKRNQLMFPLTAQAWRINAIIAHHTQRFVVNAPRGGVFHWLFRSWLSRCHQQRMVETSEGRETEGR